MATADRERYHHGDLPAALLQAVAAQVEEGGVATVGLRATARRAGVSHPAVTHHFGDLRGLLTAFAAQGHRLLAADLDAALAAADGDTEAHVLAIGLTYVRFADEHPAHFAVMFRPDVIDPDAREIQLSGHPNFALLLDAVSAHRATGWCPDRDPLALAVMVWSCVHGVAELWNGGMVEPRLRRDGIERLARPLLQLVLRQVPEGHDAGT